jgi:Sugar-binding N-terminal domain
VLDDDPTGSQTVHDVDMVTVFEPEEITSGLDRPGSTRLILTNTRSNVGDETTLAYVVDLFRGRTAL